MFTKRLLCLCALGTVPALCVETRFWQQSELADFEKGKLSRLSVRSDGRLSLAPVVRELLDSSTPYLWAVAQDSKGNIYAGGGGPSGLTAKLFQIDPQGRSKVLAELDGLEIHAIVIDNKDRVYAATAPDGKVYRITAGKSELFFDPKAKYIWSLAFARNGDLFIATGERGEIYRVTPDGRGSVFFQTEETHARSLAIDASGNLIVGTEPGGLVLRVTPAGQGFVLFQTPKREVTSVAVAADGSVYAATVGNKVPGVSLPTAPQAAPAPVKLQGGTQIVIQPAKPLAAPPPSSLLPGPGVTGGSEVYRIDAEGSPTRIWTHAQDIAYAIAFDREGRPIVGTGNKGNLYRIDSPLMHTLLVNLAPTQVTAFATGRGGQIYAVTGNIGKLYQVGPELEKQGTLESETFDGDAFTYWGRLAYTGEPAGGRVGVQVRSGNVAQALKNWSPWAPVALSGDGGRVVAPPARFLQYQLTLDAAPDGRSPEIGSVEVAFMSKNLPPTLRQIETTPANYKFASSILLPPSSPSSLTLPAMGQPRRSSTASIDLSGGSQTLSYAKGHIGVRWLPQDDNGDTLVFRVELRGAAENTWKLLRDKVRDRFISWDSTAFPDGKYVARVTASDSPSNPPDFALESTLTGDPFYIDNTPPQITGLAASSQGNKIEVRWKAKDAISIVEKAEYSIDGGDWIVVEPITKLSDAPELDYKLSITRPAPGEHTIAVRVTDEYENQSVEKTVVR